MRIVRHLEVKINMFTYVTRPNMALTWSPRGSHMVPDNREPRENSTMRTAWGPRDDHVGTSWGSCGDHVRHLLGARWGLGDHVGIDHVIGGDVGGGRKIG
jgi:hypothetical protein